MKKILIILGSLVITGTSTTSLVACHDSKTFTQKVEDVGNWKGISLPLNYFIKNKDNKNYAISYIRSGEQNWTINLVKNPEKLSLEPSYKVWKWTLETIPTLPNIDKDGNIIESN
ncbi:MAG: lipoprotein [Spiroplasma phoeniceum]|nr:MAG: lipoprotein [Spiroplasma phoeniceum]UZQ32634.1 MAG: lipoprotein [Spiroplasma phoeniceum]